MKLKFKDFTHFVFRIDGSLAYTWTYDSVAFKCFTPLQKIIYFIFGFRSLYYTVWGNVLYSSTVPSVPLPYSETLRVVFPAEKCEKYNNKILTIDSTPYLLKIDFTEPRFSYEGGDPPMCADKFYLFTLEAI